jgi:hypothetical protein
VKRPAERATAGAGGLAGVVALLGFGQTATAAALWALAAVPGAVTWLDVNGGLTGAWRRLWRGRRSG